MNPENAIEVENITKSFKVYLDKGNTIKEKILFSNRRHYENRAVLKGISFQVKKGEAIGLIGHNGCGKSTTLKLLTKIMYPDSGTIEMKGRVSSLIELGAGFHPDMSGKENIYINASIFGLTRKEIDERIEDMIAFSELRDYIDNPVRTYSSGMYMRLAFSIAINVDADILLIDEILAVGDAAFQAKCFNRLREIKGQGTTIVIVSHSLGQIEQICEKSYWIDDGLIREEGTPSEVHPHYMEYMSEKTLSKEQEFISNSLAKTKEDNECDEQEKVTDVDKVESVTDEDQGKEKIVSIDSIYLTDTNGDVKKRFVTGAAVTLNIEYSCNIDKVDKDILIGLLIFRNDNVIAYGTNTKNEKISNIELLEKGVIKLEIEKLNLVSGQYWIDVAIRKNDMFAYDYCSKGFVFDIMSTSNEVGIARIEHNWDFGSAK